MFVWHILAIKLQNWQIRLKGFFFFIKMPSFTFLWTISQTNFDSLLESIISNHTVSLSNGRWNFQSDYNCWKRWLCSVINCQTFKHFQLFHPSASATNMGELLQKLNLLIVSGWTRTMTEVWQRRSSWRVVSKTTSCQRCWLPTWRRNLPEWSPGLGVQHLCARVSGIFMYFSAFNPQTWGRMIAGWLFSIPVQCSSDWPDFTIREY